MQIIPHREPEFMDVRGGISKVLDNVTLKSVLLITSKAGSIRANHYHKKDSHYSYILSGKAEWSEKSIDGGEMETAILEPGDMVFTAPMTVHAARFLEDTTFLAFSTKERSREEYEEDTVRVTLIE